MGLSKAFSSHNSASIKLGKLPTVPTTEDLLFVLTTATKNKKPAELPFNNPYNNLSFKIKVVPATTQFAPKWTFMRMSEEGDVVLWTRVTNEVMMVQGKIKIECNYTSLGYVPPEESEALGQSDSQAIVIGSASTSSSRLPAMDESLLNESLTGSANEYGQYAEGEQYQSQYGENQTGMGDAHYATGQAPYSSGDGQYANGQAPYSSGDAHYANGQAPYRSGDAQYANGQAPYNSGHGQHTTDDSQQVMGGNQYATSEGAGQYSQTQAGNGEPPSWQTDYDPEASWINSADPEAVIQTESAHDSAWQNMAEHYASRKHTAEHDQAWLYAVEHNTGWQYKAEHDAARQSAAAHDEAWSNATAHDANSEESRTAWHQAGHSDSEDRQESWQEVAWQGRPDENVPQGAPNIPQAAPEVPAAPLDESQSEHARAEQVAAASTRAERRNSGKKSKKKNSIGKTALTSPAHNSEQPSEGTNSKSFSAPPQPGSATAAADSGSATAAANSASVPWTRPAPDGGKSSASHGGTDNFSNSLEGTNNSSNSASGTASDAWRLNKHYPGSVKLPPPAVLHPEVMTNYLASFSDPATGLLSHGAFEFFLLRDVKFAQKTGCKMSLLVFDFVNPATKEPANLSTEAIKIVAGIMARSCGLLDMCTQLRSGEFAILLCGFGGDTAVRFGEKLCGQFPYQLTDLSVLADIKSLAMGVACIPETCRDPGTLVAAAIKAKDLARESERNCLLFPPF